MSAHQRPVTLFAALPGQVPLAEMLVTVLDAAAHLAQAPAACWEGAPRWLQACQLPALGALPERLAACQSPVVGLAAY